MKKLILHIGLHKTATTHLQSELNHEIEFLKHRGVFYVPLNEFRNRITSKLGWISPEELRSELADATEFEQVVLSDENIIGGPQEVIGNNLYGRAAERITTITKAFYDYEVEVHVSIRNVGDFLTSIYCEYLRHYKFISFEKYIKDFDFDFDWVKWIEPVLDEDNVSVIKVYNFDDYKSNMDLVLKSLSFGKLVQFNPKRSKLKSRSKLTKQSISFISQFPERSIDVLRKMEAVGYVYGEPFSPFSEIESAIFLNTHIQTLKRIEEKDGMELVC